MSRTGSDTGRRPAIYRRAEVRRKPGKWLVERSAGAGPGPGASRRAPVPGPAPRGPPSAQARSGERQDSGESRWKRNGSDRAGWRSKAVAGRRLASSTCGERLRVRGCGDQRHASRVRPAGGRRRRRRGAAWPTRAAPKRRAARLAVSCAAGLALAHRLDGGLLIGSSLSGGRSCCRSGARTQE